MNMMKRNQNNLVNDVFKKKSKIFYLLLLFKQKNNKKFDAAIFFPFSMVF